MSSYSATQPASDWVQENPAFSHINNIVKSFSGAADPFANRDGNLTRASDVHGELLDQIDTMELNPWKQTLKSQILELIRGGQANLALEALQKHLQNTDFGNAQDIASSMRLMFAVYDQLQLNNDAVMLMELNHIAENFSIAVEEFQAGLDTDHIPILVPFDGGYASPHMLLEIMDILADRKRSQEATPAPAFPPPPGMAA